MIWSLVSEHGLVHPSGAVGEPALPLRFPTHAERGADGSYLVVDELASHKSVPIRSECRTLRLSAAAEVLYDSLAHGIGDGDGRLIDDGRVALLRRTQWELWLLSQHGERTDRIPLWSFSKRWPRFVSWTGNRTFLGVFLDRARLFDLVEFDCDGRLLWCLPPGTVSLGVPTSAQLLPNDRVLVADEFRHVVVEFDREGRVRWQRGIAGYPSDQSDALSSPRCAVGLADGRRLIADTRNHRLLVVAEDGACERLHGGPEGLSSPTSAQALPGGHCLVADAGNRRVIELDASGRVTWEYGGTTAARRLLSFPRSAEPDRSGVLVADTANNRVVVATGDAITPVDTPALFWPRSARRTASGALLIADGRHSRVLQVTPDGHVRETRGPALQDYRPFHDPHDAHELPNGHLLVVDPGPAVVVEIDWSGDVHWGCRLAAEVPLSDPHSAQLIADDTVMICDTGNHRLVWVNRRGATVRQTSVLRTGAGWFRLHRPRHAHASTDGTLVITDTGNNRVLGVRADGDVEWELSTVAGSPLNALDQPRWARRVGRNGLLVSDHYNHRILYFERA